jgi:colanic acid biosynthesis glycosyl transferase WcaI
MPTNAPKVKPQARRILIYGLNFWPEPVGIGKYTGELAIWLAAQGYEVRVITSPPYFPEWKIEKNQYWNQTVGGVRITRCPLWVPRRPSGLTRLVHLASFALSSLPVVMGQLWWQPDTVLAIAPAFFCAPNALLFRFLSGYRAKTILHIQDFELDAAFELGLLRGRVMRRSAELAERWILRGFDQVSSISDRMRERAIAKGVTPSRAVVLPNWIELNHIRPHTISERLMNSYRKELLIGPETAVAMYSGSMNKKQGLEVLVLAIRRLKDRTNLVWLVAGEGPTKKQLEIELEGYGNVKLLPLQPAERMNDWLNLADIHLLPQKAGAADLVLPSKVLGMMASGRPVVAGAAADTELGLLAERCGIRVPPDDAEAFAEGVAQLCDDPNLRNRLGSQGRAEVVKRFSLNSVLPAFEKVLAGMA